MYVYIYVYMCILYNMQELTAASSRLNTEIKNLEKEVSSAHTCCTHIEVVMQLSLRLCFCWYAM